MAEERLERGRAGTDDGEVALDCCPKPGVVADPGLVVSSVDGFPSIDRADDACCDDAMEYNVRSVNEF